MPEPWRIVFFGSAEFALPALHALQGAPDEIALVVTPPPAPSGRGRKLAPSPVGVKAAELGLSLLEAKNLKAPESIEAVRAARPDLLVVAAYGGFLPQELLELCPFPPLNIHPSLLPRHRGAAPVNRAIMRGDETLGVSIIFLEKEMDAGPIISQASFDYDGRSAGEWEKFLAGEGAALLLAAIAQLKDGSVKPRPQDNALATVNRLLTKEDGRVDFSRPASHVASLINGVDPWPGACTTFKGKAVKIFGAEAASKAEGDSLQPGRARGLSGEGRLVLETGDGLLLVSELQPEGKKRMSAADFQRGYQPESLGS